MSRSPQKPKHLSVVLLSSLLARLWGSLDITRLTIFRVKPKAAVARIHHARRRWPACHWVAVEDKLYCLGWKSDEPALVIRETAMSPQ